MALATGRQYQRFEPGFGYRLHFICTLVSARENQPCVHLLNLLGDRVEWVCVTDHDCPPVLARSQYEVGIVPASPVDHAAILALLDTKHGVPFDLPLSSRHHNSYSFGEANRCNVVVLAVPSGVGSGVTVAASELELSFPSVRNVFVLDAAVGLPESGLHVGDAVIATAFRTERSEFGLPRRLGSAASLLQALMLIEGRSLDRDADRVVASAGRSCGQHCQRRRLAFGAVTSIAKESLPDAASDLLCADIRTAALLTATDAGCCIIVGITDESGCEEARWHAAAAAAAALKLLLEVLPKSNS
jgi:hypothetical protein